MTETTTQIQIRKPMLSGKVEDVNDLTYPVYATVKLDGIRALMVDGKLVSRTFKSIKNNHIRTTLEAILPDAIDGELLVGTTFQDCSSGVMRESGIPDFTYYAFDYVTDSLTKPYLERMKELETWFEDNQPARVTLVLPKKINNVEELNEFEAQSLADGFEGVMVRSADGKYKEGRGTTREGLLLKLKRFSDAEAEVIGYAEKMHNMNVATKDAFGRSERSSHQENKVGVDTLGKFVCRDLETGIEFGVGTGMDDAQRAEFWANKDDLIGKIIKYKFFSIGVKEAPRHPVFLGFRDKDDM